MGYLVLEMREGSGWNDSEDHYEFPRRYLAEFEVALNDPPVIALIYEGRRGGRQAFVAWTRINQQPRRSATSRDFIVDFDGGLRSFDQPVPFAQDGVPVEHALRDIAPRLRGPMLRGRSVRSISEANAIDILMHGSSGYSRSRSYDLSGESLRPDRTQRLVTRLDRDARFRDGVLSGYRFRCAITGLGVGPGPASRLFGVLDAAHIRPVSQEGSDRPSNGIAMTPTLHRLFDAGLFTLQPKRSEIILKRSPQLQESMLVSAKARIVLEDGMRISLPGDPESRPSRDDLDFHRRQIFLKSA